MFLYVDQLEKQLDKEEFQEIGSMASFKVLETQFQMFIKSRMYMDDEYVVDLSKALDASLVDTESSGTTLKEQDTSSRSGNDAHADDADIRPIYDEEPMAEPQMTWFIITTIGKQDKRPQESSRNSEPSVMPFARSQSTTNGSKPKPRINNQKSRNWPTSKSSCVTTKTVPIADTLDS
ncbi:hypothetical protein Tco_0879024 [Tanacetum coccineum]